MLISESPKTNNAEDDYSQATHRHLQHDAGTLPETATPAQWMRAAALAARDELSDRWLETQRENTKNQAKHVYYLSMEFLIGRAMANSLAALGLEQSFKDMLTLSGASTMEVLQKENDAALGNGGLGRLAACFLDSLATLNIPSFGYGIRYEFGMFAQRIQDGMQVEQSDGWLANGNPWEIARHDVQYPIQYGGWVEHRGGKSHWVSAEQLLARAYDMIIPGHGTRRVSTLRLWKAAPLQDIDLSAHSHGDYARASEYKNRFENISWVLYPNDSTPQGRELRLRQEYFFVSASLQDILTRHLREYGKFDNLFEKVALHLNDTHPALAVPELMRLLIDTHGLDWDTAWAQCQRIFSYTNHTLMPEALETWPVGLMQFVIPRHLEIIYEINRRFLDEVRARFPEDNDLLRRVSLIAEGGEKRVRMASLSILASHKINGVSKLHSELMVHTIFADFARLFPDRFINITNGITPRRWLAQANPELAALIDNRIGPQWRLNLDQLEKLRAQAKDPVLKKQMLDIKHANKVRLAALIQRELSLTVNPSALFDVHIKRIHEYKRQLLNVLHVISRYRAILADPAKDWTPRVIIFAGKSASAYVTAKLIIHLIHDVGNVINNDARIGDKLKVVFLPNYGVSLAEKIIPAADLSEQISTAGTEASGTGNMKFTLNGALTIGTWDGANIEIAENVGLENIFIFGHHAHEIDRLRLQGYRSQTYYEENADLKGVIDMIAHGTFSQGEPTRYLPLVESLMKQDHYFLFADFASYVATQQQVDTLFRNREAWAEMMIQNVAGTGFFSSDRTISEYAKQIWQVPVR